MAGGLVPDSRDETVVVFDVFLDVVLFCHGFQVAVDLDTANIVARVVRIWFWSMLVRMT